MDIKRQSKLLSVLGGDVRLNIIQYLASSESGILIFLSINQKLSRPNWLGARERSFIIEQKNMQLLKG